ncbi:MAG TPA: hypothetical protein VMS98_05895 [Thermoanaerobaculia bacterium]|nr:hypothetical protein [Thermoanaerobaculia bacterium]
MRALKFVVAAALTTFLWILASPPYNSVLAAASQPLLWLDGRLRGVEVRGMGDRIHARGGHSRPEIPRVIIPAVELTYNIVLFAGLFATNRDPLRNRGWRRLLIALAVLFATHILAVAVSIESAYATKLGAWSVRNYSERLQDFWAAVEYVYRLAGMFGISFACWWLSVPAEARTDRERSIV